MVFGQTICPNNTHSHWFRKFQYESIEQIIDKLNISEYFRWIRIFWNAKGNENDVFQWKCFQSIGNFLSSWHNELLIWKKRCSCKAYIKHCLLNKFFPLKCAFKSSVSLTIWKRKTTEKHPFDYCIENQVFICASTSKGFSVTSFVSFSFGRLFYVCH